MSPRSPKLHSVVVEFGTADDLIAATHRLRAAGARRIETYTPFPLPELEDELVGRQTLLPVLIFLCGIAGVVWGFVMQYWGAVVSYPINIGGRPLDSWPAFVPTCFEFGVVWAVTGGFLLFLAFNRMPKFHDPVWAVPGFEYASRDAFFLRVAAADPTFDRERVQAIGRACRAKRITELAWP